MNGTAPDCEDLLLIFVKYPVPGAVKTRLVPQLTPEQAADLSKALSEDILRSTAESSSYHTRVCFAPASAYDGVRSWLGPGVSLQEQRGEDLGLRQFNAIRRARESGYSKVVLIGSDCPTITAGDIEAAFQGLVSSDLVIGPSEDGGYYLIGTQRPIRSIFQGISWSTERVMEETVARAEKAGLTIKLLDVKYDLDSYNDVERYYRSVKNHTERTLARTSLEVMDSIAVIGRGTG